jgi:tetratricopeptide (TPR) repeat protein
MEKRLCRLLLFLLFGAAAALKAQNAFYSSGCLEMFNKGDYDGSLKCTRQWLDQGKPGQERAWYYLGESHYNLGLAESEFAAARNHMEQAIQAFDQVLRSIATPTDDDRALYGYSVYKKAWAMFRRMEMEADPGSRLGELDAYLDSPEARVVTTNDTIFPYIEYLHAEVLLRSSNETRLTKMNIDDDIPAGAVNALQACIQHLDGIIDSKTFSVRTGLRNSARVRILDARMLFPAKDPSIPADYSNVRTQAGRAFSRYLSSDELFENVSIYLQSGNTTVRDRIKAYADNPEFANLSSSLQFADALCKSRDLISNVDMENEQFFLNSLKALIPQLPSDDPLAIFWRGCLQYAVNDPACLRTLDQFLSSAAQDPKYWMFSDEAKVYKLKMMMESIISTNNTGSLAAVRNYLKEFTPRTEYGRNQKEMISFLIMSTNCKTFFQNLPQHLNPQERSKIILQVIRMLYSYSSRCTGNEKQQYLDKIGCLLQFVQNLSPDEWRFYGGLKRYQETLIQGVEDYSDAFLEIAASMRNFNSSNTALQTEARYLAARCYLEAYGQNKNKGGAEAEALFKELVRIGHLRALYFLGHVYRVAGKNGCAQRCFEDVMTRAQGNPTCEIWYKAARTSIELGKFGSSAAGCQGVESSKVVCSDAYRLYDIDGIISRSYGNIENLDRDLKLIVRFGFQRKGLYPSVNKNPHSRLYPNDFSPATLNAGIQEKVGAVKGTLRVLCIPDIDESKTTITLNGQKAQRSAGGYFECEGFIGDAVAVQISDASYYEYNGSVRLDQQGVMEWPVFLEPIRKFIQDESPGLSQMIRFPDRTDGLVIFSRDSAQIAGTQMVATFNRETQFRDFAQIPSTGQYAAVRADTAEVFFFDAPQYAPSGSKPLGQTQADKLASAEGLAVDSRGNLFITDIRGNRVFVFDPECNYSFYFGTTGENHAGEFGHSVRLIRPNKIFILEDKNGLEYNGKRYNRRPRLLVTDRKGAYYLDESGNYLATVVKSKPDEYFSAVSAIGYGDECRISLYNHVTGKVLTFRVENPPVKK